jgi:hypothetical protein
VEVCGRFCPQPVSLRVELAHLLPLDAKAVTLFVALRDGPGSPSGSRAHAPHFAAGAHRGAPPVNTELALAAREARAYCANALDLSIRNLKCLDRTLCRIATDLRDEGREAAERLQRLWAEIGEACADYADAGLRITGSLRETPGVIYDAPALDPRPQRWAAEAQSIGEVAPPAVSEHTRSKVGGGNG